MVTTRGSMNIPKIYRSLDYCEFPAAFLHDGHSGPANYIVVVDHHHNLQVHYYSIIHSWLGDSYLHTLPWSGEEFASSKQGLWFTMYEERRQTTATVLGLIRHRTHLVQNGSWLFDRLRNIRYQILSRSLITVHNE